LINITKNPYRALISTFITEISRLLFYLRSSCWARW